MIASHKMLKIARALYHSFRAAESLQAVTIMPGSCEIDPEGGCCSALLPCIFKHLEKSTGPKVAYRGHLPGVNVPHWTRIKNNKRGPFGGTPIRLPAA
jgi:hypothetical protein